MTETEQAVQVLLVEDDDSLRAMLVTALDGRGYLVSTATTAAEAFRILKESDVGLVLLDLGLPDMDGTAFLPHILDVTRAPVIVISARDQENQKIAALDAGADDYLTKPFGIGELRARMRSALRRSQPGAAVEAPSRYVCGDLAVDIAQREVMLKDEPVRLTPLEFELLAALARRAGKVATHRQLLREVWGPLHEEDSHYLRIYMRLLRAKLEETPAKPRYLLTEPGVGYRLASA